MKFLIKLLLIISTFVGVVLLQNNEVKKIEDKKSEKVDYFLEEEKIKAGLTLQNKMPTLGFNNLLADRLYLEFIQYFGDASARNKTGYSAVTEFFELVEKYDPHFIDAYFIFSTANSIYGAQPKKTVSILNDILSQISPETHPYAFNLWVQKGVDEMLFLGDNKSAENSYRKAAQWAMAIGDEKAAKRPLETAEFLSKNPDSKKARVSAWFSIFKGVFDDNTREQVLAQIRALGGDVLISPDGELELKLPEKD